jgi:chromosome segregation protein
LGRTKELERLKAECARAERELERLDDRIDALDGQITEAAAFIDKTREEHGRAAADKVKLEGALQLNNRLAAVADQAARRFNDEREALLLEKSSSGESKEAINEKREALKAGLAEAEAALAAAQDAIKALIASRAELGERTTQKRMAHAAFVKDIEMARLSLNLLDGEEKALETENAQKSVRIKQADEEIRLLTGQIAYKNEEIKQTRELIAKTRTDMDEMLLSRSAGDETAARLREECRQLTGDAFNLHEECARLEARQVKAQSEMDAVINRLWDDYEVTYSEAAARAGEASNTAAAQKRAAGIKNTIKGLGNINIDAIEEYKEVKERFVFLSNQLDDLENGRESLLKIIRDMTGIMKSVFDTQFKLINENLGETFGHLFGGGRARLSLTDPNNILESGIEIEAQPPGKKLGSISLLSGGEKAFTAIAILFAILKTRPAPFLVLDEIETALDDNNVYRFAGYMKNHAEKTQFIIVTHKRGTMETADTLYGVTMQEKGVSKVLAMKMAEMAGEK